MEPRIPLPVDARIDPVWGPDLASIDPAIRAEFMQLNHVTLALDGIDPLTCELVRFRNAKVQGCHVCMSMRSAAALEQGPLDDLLEQMEGSGIAEFSEHQQLALRLADAYLSDPATMTDELRDRLLEEFTPAQLVELVLRLAVNSMNKVRVALHLDIDEVGYQVYVPGGARVEAG